MPELPEVETIVRTLRPHLLGKTIASARLLRTDIVKSPRTGLEQQIAGRSVVSIDRRGKKILIRFEDQSILCIHLGMTGQLTIAPASTPLPPHTHLVLHLTDPSSLRRSVASSLSLRFTDPRRFGGVWLLGPTDCPDSNLGPEPLSLTPKQLATLLSRTRRPIKSALLDQSLIAGLGNIYADEALFAATIHPLAHANSLAAGQIARLNRAIKRILNRAIHHRGSSISDYIDVNGASGQFQHLHQVYARENQPCRACSTPIRRIVLSGRSTHFCPQCQRLVASQGILR